MLKLIKLTEEYEDRLNDMLDEWKADLVVTGAKPIPAPIFRNDTSDMERYIDGLEYKEASGDMVPDSVFFLLDEDRDMLIGAVHIRHRLNESLFRWSGHIGIGIRPGERRKGYATKMLRLALAECVKLGIDRVLMTCDKANIGSAKAIVNNGGVLEYEFVNQQGTERQRYWIDLQ